MLADYSNCRPDRHLINVYRIARIGLNVGHVSMERYSGGRESTSSNGLTSVMRPTVALYPYVKASVNKP